jgi:transcriptional regulator with XRE-family HTH domain
MSEEKKSPKTYGEMLENMHPYGKERAEADLLEGISALTAPAQESFEPVPVGERIKAIREAKGLTLEDIASRTGLSPELLNQVETDLISPPLGTLVRLAKALEMKMGTLISGGEKKPFTVVRKVDRKVVSRYASKKGKRYGYYYESLAPDKRDRNMEPFLVTLEPSDVEEATSVHAGEEFIFVLEGEMEAILGDHREILGPGDAIYYDSTYPHLVKCHQGDRTLILAVLFTEDK